MATGEALCLIEAKMDQSFLLGSERTTVFLDSNFQSLGTHDCQCLRRNTYGFNISLRKPIFIAFDFSDHGASLLCSQIASATKITHNAMVQYPPGSCSVKSTQVMSGNSKSTPNIGLGPVNWNVRTDVLGNCPRW